MRDARVPGASSAWAPAWPRWAASSPTACRRGLGRGQLTDQPLGERRLLVPNLRIDTPIDLAGILDLAGKGESLKEEPVLVRADRDRRTLAVPGEPADR